MDVSVSNTKQAEDTLEIKTIKSENNKQEEKNTDSIHQGQEKNMEYSQEILSDNIAILQKEHNVVKQTVIRQNIINDKQDNVNINNKNDDEYFSLPAVQDEKSQGNQISDIQNKDIQNIQYQEIKASSDEMQTPARIIADYVFLLGRLTMQAITDHDGNTIIPKNTLITANIVLTAFNNGKLLELTKYSKS